MHQRQARRFAPVCQWWSDFALGHPTAARVPPSPRSHLWNGKRSGGRYALVTMCSARVRELRGGHFSNDLCARSAGSIKDKPNMLPATITVGQLSDFLRAPTCRHVNARARVVQNMVAKLGSSRLTSFVASACYGIQDWINLLRQPG